MGPPPEQNPRPAAETVHWVAEAKEANQAAGPVAREKVLQGTAQLGMAHLEAASSPEEDLLQEVGTAR